MNLFLLATTALAVPHSLDKRAATPVTVFVTNGNTNVGAGASIRVNLGWETAVLKFNCQSSNWVTTCSMVHCGYTIFGTLVNCSPSRLCPPKGQSTWNPQFNRETTTVYYSITPSSSGCRTRPF